eukprot:510930-Alexandrium_andersonii.AAC.1
MRKCPKQPPTGCHRHLRPPIEVNEWIIAGDLCRRSIEPKMCISRHARCHNVRCHLVEGFLE